jgi:FeS assembly protein IscX
LRPGRYGLFLLGLFCSDDFILTQEFKMPPTFGWDNFEDIAIGLTDKFPDTDPLTVRFTDLHKWIIELPGFSGDPAASNEAKLEAIQMAWHEEYKDRQG